MHRSIDRGLVALAWTPLVVIAVGWSLSPSLRATLGRGVELLVARDLDGLRAWGSELGLAAPLFTTALMIVQAIAAPIPAVLVTWTNSWLFGPFLGALHSIASATLAAAICFLLARSLGRRLVERLVSERKRELAERFLERHGASAVIAARLLPFVPFDPISFVAGLSTMRAWTFAWATFVGQIPAGFAYSYLGQQIGEPQRMALLLACALLALIAIGWSFARWTSKRSRG